MYIYINASYKKEIWGIKHIIILPHQKVKKKKQYIIGIDARARQQDIVG